ncbi:MAG: hypothetical protein GY809_06635, partial [Planctomycetes bacterium]|nr:hypothetical protein [Planctomycetota bacterium]
MDRPERLSLVFGALLLLGLGCAHKAEYPTVKTPEMGHAAPSFPDQPSMVSASASSGMNNAGPSLAQRSITTFTKNMSISEGDVYDVLVVKGRHISLNISGGQVKELIVKDENQVSVTGGTIEAMTIYDNCLAEISGGSIDTVSGYGKNKVTLRDNAQIIALHSYGETHLIVESDEATLETIQYFTKCGCVDQSQRARLDLSGGRFRNIGTGLSDVLLTITGQDLSKSAYGGTYGYGMVKGRWKNGTD